MLNNKNNSKQDDTAYLSVLRLTKNGVDSTVCLYGANPTEVFMKTATFQSLYNSQENTRVSLIGTYTKTPFEVVAKGQ